jgi:chromosome partitioning protein
MSLREVLIGEVPAERAIVDAPGGVKLLPANADLSDFEDASARMLRPESALREALSAIADDFDYALLDCPARADGVLSANALRASSVAILVVETGAFALQGALRARKLFEGMARAQGSRFDIRVLGTLFDKRTKCGREFLLAIHARFGADMFDTVIRESVKLREAAARGVPIQEFAPRSGAAEDFASLAEEIAALELRTGEPLMKQASFAFRTPDAEFVEHEA